MYVRVEVAVRPEFTDPEAETLLRRIELALPDVRRRIRWARVLDVYWVYADLPRESMIGTVVEVFQDPVCQWLFTGDLIPSASGSKGGLWDVMDASPHRNGKFFGIERRYRLGVTDSTARSVQEAFQIVTGRPLDDMLVASGRLALFESTELTDRDLEQIATQVFSNELIESWTLLEQEELKKNSRFHADQVKRQLPVKVNSKAWKAKSLKLAGLSDQALLELSQRNLWALSLEEMQAIQKHFSDPQQIQKRKEKGLEDPTDVEIEVLAQTWSEHCKHKIFSAQIEYSERSSGFRPDIPTTIDSLFKTTIWGTTEEIPREWLLSVFKDNAGIVAFDEDDAVCIKVETHNSPSALDPYGGALTGIGGVNRDILGCGLGAKPIANTNVFCVAAPDKTGQLPDRLLHPRRILDGVRRGVEDGGNKSGIPTVNGALVFDDRYLGKPLIYCGTVGIMPRVIRGRRCETKEIKPGDKVVMVGGRIGKDGIHGATFSSLALDESSPSSAVQLGDPICQKRALDFILEARNYGLYRAITDNGAGGLSSSVGEMAQLSNGARIDVSLAKTKYPGLKPYELVISESQERMTLAVPADRLQEFQKLAESRSVEVSVLGEFTSTGTFEIWHGKDIVASLDLKFLHDGVPRLKLVAEWNQKVPQLGAVELSFEKEGAKRLLDLMGRPNIASKEWLIRQYDHEVQGSSVVKPLHTVQPGTASEWSGPNDASVLKPKSSSWTGLAIGCGIAPRYSDVDPYLMGQMAVDEAVRNILAVGAEFGRPDSLVSLVDNFCWPDPVKDSRECAALVRTCYGMREAALALNAPFISGKDSMKNNFKGKLDQRDIEIAVVPTLLVTALGRVSDIRESRTADFKAPGDMIYLLSRSDFGLVGSELHQFHVDRLKDKGGNQAQVVLPSAVARSGPGEKPYETGLLRAPMPNWEVGRQIYTWLGGSVGERQISIRSVHDISDGGLLVAISESLLARGLGATLHLPEEIDLWEFCFGEAFHSFVVSVKEADRSFVESEWRDLGVPFTRLGSVIREPELTVKWTSQGAERNIRVPVAELRQAWLKEGYWQ